MGFKGRGEILGSYLGVGLRHPVLVRELGGGLLSFSDGGPKFFNRSPITLKLGADYLEGERESQERGESE